MICMMPILTFDTGDFLSVALRIDILDYKKL